MKFSAAAVSLLLAATATVEASSVHDSPLPKRHHEVPRNSNYGTIKPADHGHCNHIGATSQITAQSGPNGHIDWLNCGINGQGWTPAPVQLEELIVVPLKSARHTTFAPCSDLVIAIFEKYGKQHNIPSILLASFAMQESTCNPNVVGGAGEQGLMQITPEKCHGAPNGNCKDIDFNIKTGAAYFASLLEGNCGDILLTIGQYNGWKLGMTHGDATRAAPTCCRCQNNLDYVHQFVNGWLQGVDAYKKGLGKYHNLNKCH